VNLLNQTKEIAMQALTRNAALLCVLGFTLIQPAAAASPAVRDMAGVMLNFAHYPSDAQKATLKGIVDNKASTEQERLLANAILKVEHHAADADKPQLKQLMNDASIPAEVRNLAGIVLNLNHKPSAADTSVLQAMTK
jgi:hypothetical protein